MKKIILGFIAGVMSISFIAFAAVYNTVDELETDIRAITQIKQATHQGEPVFVMKWEGDLQGIPVSKCRVFFPNQLNTVPAEFTNVDVYHETNPPRPFDEIEYLCWTPYETVVYGGADTGLAYDRVNAQFMSINTGARCGPMILGWPNGWHVLRADNNVFVYCGPQMQGAVN